MHAPPAVSFSVGRSTVHGRCLAATLLLSLVVGVLWLDQAADPGWRQVLYLLLFLVTSGLAISQWRRAPTGQLQWDGRVWHWSAWPDAACSLQVRVDGQSWLLASLCSEAGSTLWLWLERQSDVASWPALRCNAWHADEQHFFFLMSAKPTAVNKSPQAAHVFCCVGSTYRPAARSWCLASLQHSGQDALSAP
jgi:hypothetical protein